MKLTLAIVVLALIGAADAGPPRLTLVCTNPYSGTSWKLGVDYNRATVDSYPAHISANEITWHDRRDGGHYTLTLSSGNLSAVFPSSTGGYFLHDHCVRQS